MMSKTIKNAPIAEMLEAVKNSTRFHMPGHKGQLSLADTTELRRTDNLYAPYAAILEAEALAAKACGASQTIMVTGGATAGLQAMLLAFVPTGKKLILSRNVHHAVISALALGDIDAVFTDNVMAAMTQHSDAAAVLITRPDYFGNCIELAPIAEFAAENNILLLVDEAHGAHFPWWSTPKSASKYGANAWVQSAHKTLPALTGAAFLHIGEGMDGARARRFLRMVQTSSPPFPILESLDNARAWMDENGMQALTDLKKMIADITARINTLGGYRVIVTDDPTRLLINTRGHGLTGFETQALLEAQRVDVEMADVSQLVCICTVSDNRKSFSRLYNALAYIPQKEALPPLAEAPPLAPGERVLSIRAATFSAHTVLPADQAVGHVAAISTGLYPPGIPLVLPGERITEACVERLLSLPDIQRFGIENGSLLCVKDD